MHLWGKPFLAVIFNRKVFPITLKIILSLITYNLYV
jgi:general stress protein CsbA